MKKLLMVLMLLAAREGFCQYITPIDFTREVSRSSQTAVCEICSGSHTYYLVGRISLDNMNNLPPNMYIEGLENWVEKYGLYYHKDCWLKRENFINALYKDSKIEYEVINFTTSKIYPGVTSKKVNKKDIGTKYIKFNNYDIYIDLSDIKKEDK